MAPRSSARWSATHLSRRQWPAIRRSGADGAGHPAGWWSTDGARYLCIVRNDGCTIYTSGIYYEFTVLGTVQGKVYTFHFQIGGLGPSAQNYSGPGTYTTNTGIGLGVGDHPVNPNQPTWTALTTGTITVNGGEKSGSVHALLNINEQTSGTVQATGTWACSTLQHL